MVAWHAASAIGPIDEIGVFANVTTDPMEVSRSAAMWAFADAGGKPNVVIFTDSTYQIAIDKADRMKEVDVRGTGFLFVARHPFMLCI